MITQWSELMRSRGSRGFHLGVGPANARAVRFYGALGLEEIERIAPPFNVIYFGRKLT
jgi:hypothetical protein